MSDAPAPPPATKLTRTPAPAPFSWFDIRADIAARVLSGSGIEIGGLHYPLAMPPGIEVRYVDRMSVPKLREHYPELNHLDLVEVDIVDDGEQLNTIPDGSLDFIVANHFLEHCHDPIATIFNHMSKLAPGGVLFYAVPDKRFTFDVDREVTPLDHMIRDHEQGPAWSRKQHFDEWARYVYENPDEPIRTEEEVRGRAHELDEEDYSIHTHVFTQQEILQLILHCRDRSENAFDIEVVWRRLLELIVVLRKQGPVKPPAGFLALTEAAARTGEVRPEPPAAPPASPPEPRATALRAASTQMHTRLRRRLIDRLARIDRKALVNRLSRTTGEPAQHHQSDSGEPPSARVSVPMSVLPSGSDAAWPSDARWRPSVEIGAVTVPALELGVDAPAAFRLRLPGAAVLRAKLAAAPDVVAPAGAQLKFSMTLSAADRSRADDRGVGIWSNAVEIPSPGWTDFTVVLPSESPDEVELSLAISSVSPVEQATRLRGLWGALTLELPERAIPQLPAVSPTPSPRQAAARRLASTLDELHSPLISILMPVHDPEPRFLEEAIACVRQQTFSDWQLCLADDGSSDERVRALLARHASEDERIELTRHAPARGISGATNAALELARGEYIALMDHDDLITNDALEAFAALIHEQPDLDMVYCDEDRVSTDGTEHSHTFFKPDWSPDLFRTAMYTCHLSVYRRRLAVALGGFRSEFDGSQDYDFVLRLIECTDRIGHIPRVLYSWRIHSLSAASGVEAKPAAAEAARAAIEGHLARTGVAGSVELGPHAGWYTVHYTADRAAQVTLVVPLPTRPASVHDESALADCARSWEVATHDRLDVMLAGTHETLAAHARLLGDAELGLERAKLCVVADDQPGSARLINQGVRETGNELLLLMQEPLLAQAAGWIAQLAAMASQPGVAAAGGLVLSSDGRVQGGAVVFGDGWPLPAVYDGGDLLFPALTANFRALNVALMLRRETFEGLGGLDERLGDLALVDLCLRAGQYGLRAVLCSDVTFARSRLARPIATDPALIAAFRARWRFLGPDPYYNPSYWQGRGDFSPVAG